MVGLIVGVIDITGTAVGFKHTLVSRALWRAVVFTAEITAGERSSFVGKAHRWHLDTSAASKYSQQYPVGQINIHLRS